MQAIESDEISKSDLIAEAETLFIPWQMFLLTPSNLTKHLRRIEKNRADKINVKQLAHRAGFEGQTPYRLIDRYIRAQTFLLSHQSFSPNAFCNSLSGKTTQQAVTAISSHFNIDRDAFWNRRTKELARDYLIEKLTQHQVNVAIGSSDARLMPSSDNHRKLYKNISGFCLKDDRVPFIFINANLSDYEEPIGRQIYTTLYLLALIGLGYYTLTRDWRPGKTSGAGNTYFRSAHRIASEFLFPTAELEKYRGKPISKETISSISNRFKLTPTAVAFRLHQDGLIGADETEKITPEPFKKSGGPRTPRIDRTVRRLNGSLVVNAVNASFGRNRITQNQAQYILFGRIRRKLWRDYRALIGL
jgi:hypothetical protein